MHWSTITPIIDWGLGCDETYDVSWHNSHFDWNYAMQSRFKIMNIIINNQGNVKYL
jgi:hypothetical protein